MSHDTFLPWKELLCWLAAALEVDWLWHAGMRIIAGLSQCTKGPTSHTTFCQEGSWKEKAFLKFLLLKNSAWPPFLFFFSFFFFFLNLYSQRRKHWFDYLITVGPRGALQHMDVWFPFSVSGMLTNKSVPFLLLIIRALLVSRSSLLASIRSSEKSAIRKSWWPKLSKKVKVCSVQLEVESQICVSDHIFKMSGQIVSMSEAADGSVTVRCRISIIEVQAKVHCKMFFCMLRYIIPTVEVV